MKLTKFRVQMFKSIIDSGWIDVDPLTVVVGKNESGKTTLLKALHKFNSSSKLTYDFNSDWPRAKRTERSEDTIVCTAVFALDKEERSQLDLIAEVPTTINTITVTKDYGGAFEIDLGPEFPDRLHPNAFDALLLTLTTPTEPVREQFRTQAIKTLAHISLLAAEGRYSELEDYRTLIPQTFAPYRTQGNGQPHTHNEQTFISHVDSVLRNLRSKLTETPTIQQRAHEYLISRMPTFVYMDEYKTFQGRAILNQVKDRASNRQLSPEDETFLTILTLSGLDLDLLVKQGSQSDREQRQFDLSDGAATLTNIFAQHWKALRYEIEFIADGQEFFTMVKNEKDRARIKLEERSRGFQWFFSFDLLFMHETKGSMANAVILLDEPGLHLHPQAQQDLLERLEAYAETNTLIYTTHLPFMLNLREPQRIRIINDGLNGAVVTSDLTTSSPDAKLTLQAALGMSSRQSHLVAHKNLVVEGVDDYWILCAISDFFYRHNLEGLSEDILITPAGGASEATYIATFMTGQNLGVFALYDHDESGRKAKDDFVKKWLTKYKDRHAMASTWGEFLSEQKRDFEIEDVFDSKFYLNHVIKTYPDRFKDLSKLEESMPPEGVIVDRVQAAFDAVGHKFNKGSVAKRICSSIRQMKSADDLSTQTREIVGRAIRAINNALP